MLVIGVLLSWLVQDSPSLIEELLSTRVVGAGVPPKQNHGYVNLRFGVAERGAERNMNCFSSSSWGSCPHWPEVWVVFSHGYSFLHRPWR